MAMIPREIEPIHVLRAAEALQQGTDHSFGPFTDYDLLHDGHRYPPKAVVGIAAGFAAGRRLHPAEFGSGIGAGQACRVLHDLGFRIVGKDSEHDVFEVPTFIPGEVYRRRDLHAQYGGQGQGSTLAHRKVSQPSS